MNGIDAYRMRLHGLHNAGFGSDLSRRAVALDLATAVTLLSRAGGEKEQHAEF